MQVFDEAFAEEFEFDVLDATKIIPEEQVPVRAIAPADPRPGRDNVFAETEQVAFCTQNVVPGIDFTNDPLLQGRNFSYLDTQLKRLGSPNFTQIPINAPRCPVAHFQRDGHMQMSRAGGARQLRAQLARRRRPGPARRRRQRLHHACRARRAGSACGVRSETFADHYSQARQFCISQTDVEQQHIVAAYAFELGKCELPAIRTRMLGNLRNVHEDLATGSRRRARHAAARGEPGGRSDRAPTCPSRPALSILLNGPDSFAGRKLGVLVTAGPTARWSRRSRTRSRRPAPSSSTSPLPPGR